MREALRLLTSSASAPHVATATVDGYIYGYPAVLFDLSEPVELRVPAIRVRYALFALLDAWTNNFAEVREAPEAQRFLLVGPGFGGAVPDGHRLLRAPTPGVWVIGRIQILPGDEIDADGINQTIRVLQAQCVLDTSGSVVSAPVPIECPVAPPEVVASLSARDFFNRLGDIVEREGAPDCDSAKPAVVEWSRGADDAALEAGVGVVRLLLSQAAMRVAGRGGLARSPPG